MTIKKFEFLSHTADAKFITYGKTIEKCFENSALALSNVMYKGKVKPKIKTKIKVEGKELDLLLYNFLEQILILLDYKNIFVSKTKVKIDLSEKKMKLSADIWGDNAGKYKIGGDVKAITYNDLYVKKTKNGWECQVVVDV